ncbi:MAG: sensor histidine kinase [Sphingomonadales bacterium]
MSSHGRSARWLDAFARLHTTAKIIVILSLALMPLGIIALLASLQTTRTADEQRRAELRIATTEASRKLATELSTDIFTLRQALQAIDAQADNNQTCMRASALLRAHGSGSVRFALFGTSSTAICSSSSLSVSRPPTLFSNADVSLTRSGDDLDLIVPSPTGSSVAVVRYAPTTIARFARPEGYGLPYRLTIEIEGSPLVVIERSGDDILGRTEEASLPVGIGNMTLSMTVSSASFGAAEALLAFLPLLMWASASIIGFYIVDRLLIRPLKALRVAVVTYEPGSARRVLAGTPAIEIRELESSFTAYADRLADREHEVEGALANQVRLTREVHHRVKNNLQVIASLISLHARDSGTPDAANAYASIQRRVDALAIVHRNHYAELEANNGIDARALLSELVANFRANGRVNGETPAITLAAVSINIGQDVATPLAFLFTELAEASLLTDAQAPIAVSLVNDAKPDVARFTISSTALAVEPLVNRSAYRIVEGLARQLRSPLERNDARTSFSIVVPVMLDAATENNV